MVLGRPQLAESAGLDSEDPHVWFTSKFQKPLSTLERVMGALGV